jgi:hypothetical protein
MPEGAFYGQEATMPEGAFYGQEATMPEGAFYGQEGASWNQEASNIGDQRECQQTVPYREVRARIASTDMQGAVRFVMSGFCDLQNQNNSPLASPA